jgi:hypothetical protein
MWQAILGAVRRTYRGTVPQVYTITRRERGRRMKIDYKLLSYQKQYLIGAIEDAYKNGNANRLEGLEGILNLLDAISDESEGENE